MTESAAQRFLLERLGSRQLLVVTGKGGVGKSAVSAALGRCLSQSGKRVVIVEVDPRESLHQMFGIAPSGGELVEVEAGLRIQNLRPRHVLDELVHRQLRLGALVRRVLASPVYQHFAEGAPGLKELAVVGQALRLTGETVQGERADVVVLDAPATGHGVSLLMAPQLVHEVISGGPFGHMARDLARLVASPERCGVVVVTSAEEMPVQEALELRHMLASRLERRPELLVVNGLYPPLEPAPTGTGGSPELEALWRRRREINERETHRLLSSWQGPSVLLPLLPSDRGPQLLAALQGQLERALADLGEDRWS